MRIVRVMYEDEYRLDPVHDLLDIADDRIVKGKFGILVIAPEYFFNADNRRRFLLLPFPDF